MSQQFGGAIESDNEGGSPPSRPTRSDISGIQYLRGFAALIVVIYHLSLQWRKMVPASPVYETLQSGVDVFFLISGFVMVYSTHGGSKLPASEFMIHRIVRIVPLYWAITFATAAILIAVPSAATVVRLDGGLLAASLFFVPYANSATQDYTPLVIVGWTLNYEMLFYVVFALCIWLGRRRPAVVIFATLAVLALLPVVGLMLKPEGLATYFTSPMLLEFAVGMVVALAFGPASRLPLLGAMFLAAIGAAWLILPPPGEPAMRVIRFGPPAVLLLLAALQGGPPKLRWAQRLGDISYSLYLSHFLLLAGFAAAWKRAYPGAGSLSHVLFFFTGTAMALVTGYLCWRWVERPLTRYAKQLFARNGLKLNAGAQ